MHIRKYLMSTSQIGVSLGVMGTAFYRNVFTPDGSAFLWAAFVSAGRTALGGIVEFIKAYNEPDTPVHTLDTRMEAIRVEDTSPSPVQYLPLRSPTHYRDLVSQSDRSPSSIVGNGKDKQASVAELV